MSWARLLALATLLGCSSAPLPKATEGQVLCLVDREASILACVKANPDRASIDACLARAEATECTDAGFTITSTVEGGAG